MMKTYYLEDKNCQKYLERVKANCELLVQEKFSLSDYIDPDLRLEEIKVIGNKEYRMSPDGICGIKYLLQYYDGENLMDAYSCIRNKIIMWPKHRNNINQRRYAFFRDRIDFTLYDFMLFYTNQSGKSKLVLKNSASAEFLDEIGSFEAFITEYELNCFIDSKTLMVQNLITKKDITDYNECSFSIEDNKKYIQGLLDALNKS